MDEWMEIVQNTKQQQREKIRQLKQNATYELLIQHTFSN